MSYKFVMEEWLSRFPLDENAERYSGEIVTSPRDACNNEWLRRAMQDEYRWGPPAPVDIFIMARRVAPSVNLAKRAKRHAIQSRQTGADKFAISALAKSGSIDAAE